MVFVTEAEAGAEKELGPEARSKNKSISKNGVGGFDGSGIGEDDYRRNQT